MLAAAAATKITTDATPTLILTWTPPDDASTTYEIWVSGVLADHTGGLVYRRSVGFRRASGGNATIVAGSASGDTIEDAGLTTATIVVTVSTTDVVIQVTGIAATTFHWHAVAYQMGSAS